jgi:YVTN family beta-propeller protein
MWHRRIYYHLAVHAHRAGLPPVDLVSEDGTVKALVLLLVFAATLLAGSERIYVANTGGADISVIDPATNSVIGVIRVSKHPHAIFASLDKSRLYVPSEQEDVLDVVDLGTSKVIHRVPPGRQPNNLAITPDSREYPSELIDRPEHAEQSVRSYVKVTAKPPGGRDQLLKKVVAVRTANNGC